MPDFNQTAPDFNSPPMPPPSDDYVPQFSTVQYTQPAAIESCANCSTLLSSQYYVANGKRLCPECAKQAVNGGLTGADHAAFMRAIVFGIGGAIVGLALYAAVTIAARGWTIGYLALAVGWLVAKAMLQGSGSRGGRQYQIAAAILTYAAISLAYVPAYIYFIYNRHIATPNWSAIVARLVIYGIASPFLGLGRNLALGVLNLFIIFIGIRIAWRMTRTRPLPIAGPYKVGTA
jgi:hypothetical protein